MLRRLCGRKKAACLLGGGIYALFAAFGWQAEHNGGCNPALALVIAAVLFLPAAEILAWLFEKSEARKRSCGEKPFRTGRAFALILACYVPMMLITFPGSFAYDVPYQLRQVVTGQYSTHHPLLHTLLLDGLLQLGQRLGNINIGAALYTGLQMVLLAGCFALTCASIARQCSARAGRRAAVFFALYPLHMMMAVNATKDVLFSGCFALTVALLCELTEKPTARLTAAAALCGALAAMMRNNMAYAAIVWLVLWLPAMRKKGKAAAIAMALALILGLGGNAMLKAATHAVDGDMSEMLSVPIQQMARARLLESEKLTEEEKTAIDALMPDEAWRLYDPTISDPVKFEFDTKTFRSNVGYYGGIWLSVGAKCPNVYLDALLMQTYSFFYPYSRYGVSGYYLQMGMSEAYDESWCGFAPPSSRSFFPRVLASLSWRFGAQGAMQIPVIGWAFNMGLIVWTLFFFVLREMYAGRWKRFCVFLLPVLLWGTFLLGPVMAGRYIYPFVCVLPAAAGKPMSGECKKHE